jgi:carbamoyltransferase
MTWDGGEPQLGEVYSKKMRETFGEPRVPRSEVTERHSDIAASVQTVLEENYFALLNHVYRETKEKNLCLAGGVALNCAANGKIFQNTPFERLYIQPGAHDSGTSIGAALYTQHQILNQPRTFVMKHVYYGPEHDDSAVLDQLKSAGLTYRRLPTEELLSYVANAIADGKILGWFQGRMEFGPRALGNRSILADPRSDTMKEVLNSRIKYREPFRPFCPSILAEHTSDYFEMDAPAPFMVTAYKIRPQMRSRIRAVTHADGTGRLQTVERDSNPLYWSLIKRFYEITGVPVLLNTSFNENEPIVNTPREAVECFLRTEMDVLAIGSYLLLKSENHHVTPGRTPYAVAEAKQDAASRQLIV